MNIEVLSLELNQVQLQDEQALEQFRIRFLGSKNAPNKSTTKQKQL